MKALLKPFDLLHRWIKADHARLLIAGLIASGFIAAVSIFAAPGDYTIKIDTPEPGSTKNSDFHIKQTISTAKENVKANSIVTIDGRVVDIRIMRDLDKSVTMSFHYGALSNDEKTHSEQFDRELLGAGEHQIKAELRSGDSPGRGNVIASDTQRFKTGYTSADPLNLASYEEQPISATAPAPGNPILHRNDPRVHFTTKAAYALGRSTVLAAFTDTVKAHSGTGKRHGNLLVIARKDDNGDGSFERVPGVTFRATSHAAELGDCHGQGGSEKTTNADGDVLFQDCPMSNNGSSGSATYDVYVVSWPGNMDLISERNRQVQVPWNAQGGPMHFTFKTKSAPPPPPGPAPPPPAATYYYPPNSPPMLSLVALANDHADIDGFSIRRQVDDTTGAVHNERDENFGNFKSLSATVDGVLTDTHPPRKGTNALPTLRKDDKREPAQDRVERLRLSNLCDGNPHTVVLTGEAMDGQKQSMTVAVAANPSCAAPTPPAPGGPTTQSTGALQVNTFIDANDDCAKQTDEANLAEVEVSIAHTNFPSPQFTATTDASGKTFFSNLDGGTWIVNATTPAGFDRCTPLPANVPVTPAQTTLNTFEIGYTPQATPTAVPTATPTPEVIAQTPPQTPDKGPVAQATRTFSNLPATGQAGVLTFLTFLIASGAYYGLRWFRSRRGGSGSDIASR